MRFKIFRDPDYGWVVADASVSAHSFAMVPAVYEFSFDTKAEAEEQARALQGKEIELRWLETPDRFEAVADTLYGTAWGNH